MKQLEELEKKVLQVISENKELKNKFDVLTKEHKLLLEKNKQSEDSLIKEKSAMKNSIDALIKSISSFEEAS